MMSEVVLPTWATPLSCSPGHQSIPRSYRVTCQGTGGGGGCALGEGAIKTGTCTSGTCLNVCVLKRTFGCQHIVDPGIGTFFLLRHTCLSKMLVKLFIALHLYAMKNSCFSPVKQANSSSQKVGNYR